MPNEVSLEADGIISPVAVTDWGSPLVVILKPDKRVRFCVDLKCGVVRIDDVQQSSEYSNSIEYFHNS